MNTSAKQWYEDPYWTEGLEQYQVLAASNRLIALDLDAIEKAAYANPSPAFKLQAVMAAMEEDDDPDKYRGVPRVFFALLAHLHAISNSRDTAGDQP